MKKLLPVLLLPICVVFMGADDSCGSSGEKAQVSAQKTLSDEADRQVGLPGVTNFTEKRIVRKLYELRDKNIATYTYVMDMEGRLWHVCDSIGYGLPYGVQFTNPLRPAYANETHEAGNIALPQPEPNALYMPPTADGTWVICASEIKKGDIEPMYVEPHVISSPYKLKSAGDWQLHKGEAEVAPPR